MNEKNNKWKKRIAAYPLAFCAAAGAATGATIAGCTADQTPNTDSVHTITMDTEENRGIDKSTYNKFMELKEFFKDYDKSMKDMQDDIITKKDETEEERAKRQEFVSKLEELREISQIIVKEKIKNILESSTGKNVNLDDIMFMVSAETGHIGINYKNEIRYEAPYDNSQYSGISDIRKMPIFYEIVIGRADTIGELLGHEVQQKTPQHVLEYPSDGINGWDGLIQNLDMVLDNRLITDSKGNIKCIPYEKSKKDLSDDNDR